MVVVDDGCPFPETAETAQGFAALHPGQVFLLRRRNGGLSAARNTGVEFALAAFPSCRALFFLDADNRLLPPFLARAWAAMQAAPPGIGWLYPDFDEFGGTRNWSAAGDWSLLQLLAQNYCEAGSLVRREVFEAGPRFDETMRGGFEDWDFWLQAAAAGFAGQHLPHSGFLYRRRPESMLAASERQRPALLAALHRKHAALLRPGRLLALEAAEAPRFALHTPDRAEVRLLLDPAGPPLEVVPAALARQRLLAAEAAPAARAWPAILVFATEEALALLRDHGLIRNLFWLAETALRGRDLVAVEIVACEAGEVVVEGRPGAGGLGGVAAIFARAGSLTGPAEETRRDPAEDDRPADDRPEDGRREEGRSGKARPDRRRSRSLHAGKVRPGSALSGRARPGEAWPDDGWAEDAAARSLDAEEAEAEEEALFGASPWERRLDWLASLAGPRPKPRLRRIRVGLPLPPGTPGLPLPDPARQEPALPDGAMQAAPLEPPRDRAPEDLAAEAPQPGPPRESLLLRFLLLEAASLDRARRRRSLLPSGWRQDFRGRRDTAAARVGALAGLGTLLPCPPQPGRRSFGFVLPLFALGGVERVVLNQALVLRARGWRTHLFVLGASRIAWPEGMPAAFESINLLPALEANEAEWRNPYFGAEIAAFGSRPGATDALGLLAGMDAVLNTHSLGGHALMARLRSLGIQTFCGLHLVERGAWGDPLGTPHSALAYEHAYDGFTVISDQLRHWCIAQGVPAAKLHLLRNAPAYPAEPGRIAAAGAARQARAGGAAAGAVPRPAGCAEGAG
ncbi:glycosyltransferase family A protein [Siccirubricoccus sp. G192]|uniref:glycosyltransferase family A protein n=1 Tax=Siccirubricoccus sp. G192 TaxID=2849651 RepID=UPI001C2C77A7|nr:glycosyltransferase family A protein [Siccirubricoccus sp. G192]MBV1796214.1 glycosyltransferase family 2 protein [Siccirubricoccus sp. G192]